MSDLVIHKPIDNLSVEDFEQIVDDRIRLHQAMKDKEERIRRQRFHEEEMRTRRMQSVWSGGILLSMYDRQLII